MPRTLSAAASRSNAANPHFRAVLAAFEDIGTVDYAALTTRIREAVSTGSSKITQVQLAKELAGHFRATYRRAGELAREGK